MPSAGRSWRKSRTSTPSTRGLPTRNVRREGMDLLKRLDKDGDMSEDEHHKNSAKVQELTDKLINDIDQALAAKEAEIKQV